MIMIFGICVMSGETIARRGMRFFSTARAVENEGKTKTRKGCHMNLMAPLVALLLSACTTGTVIEQSRQDFATGDPKVALSKLHEKVLASPGDAELRAYFVRQRDQLVNDVMKNAGRARDEDRLEDAEALYREVLELDFENSRARAVLDEIAGDRRRLARITEARAAFDKGDTPGALRLIRGVLASAPGDKAARELLRAIEERAERTRPRHVDGLEGALARTVTLEFRDASLRMVFEALSRASGLNFVFDKDVRAESKVTLFVRETSLDEVLKLLTVSQGLSRKILNANSVLIYPATVVKQKDYLDLVTRSFYLANADAKAAQSMVKQIVKSRDVFIDEKLNLLVIKDTPAAVRLAERVISSLDVAEPELMLEVEVLEVSRGKLQDLGIDFPDQIGYGLLTPSTPAPSQIVNGVVISGTTQLGGKLLDGNINLRERGDLVPFISNPAAVLRLKSEDGDSTLLANPRIRVRNREKAKIHIGERLPVFTTTSTANVGVTASVAYLDVGLKLEVEPAVYLGDEVGIKIALEVSSIVKEVPGPSSSLAYQVGTRSATTALRLKNGETQVLAGLINDEERSSAQRVPGLGALPLIGKLFSAQRDSNSKTEIILLITPRVLRNVMPPDGLLADFPAGTEMDVGASPILLNTGASHGLRMYGEGRAGAPGLPGADLRTDQAPEAPRSPTPDERAPGVSPSANVTVPENAVRGELINVSIEVSGLGDVSEAVLMLSYDAARLDHDGASSGRPGSLRLPLEIQGGTATADVAFRVKEGALGRATIAITGAVVGTGGDERVIPLSKTAAIAITR